MRFFRGKPHVVPKIVDVCAECAGKANSYKCGTCGMNGNQREKARRRERPGVDST